MKANVIYNYFTFTCTLILLVEGLCTKPPTPQDNLNLEPITYPLKNKTNPKAQVLIVELKDDEEIDPKEVGHGNQ